MDPEDGNLTRTWMAIAKVEWLVRTAKVRRARKVLVVLAFSLATVWALYLLPLIWSFFLWQWAEEAAFLLAMSFPGLMRSGMLFLWLIVLIGPLSSGLQEIRIGQWEIMLSNNVKTRDMLFGTFLGKIPFMGLQVLIMAPVVLTPFILAYKVSLLGQSLMYAVMLILILSTSWISNTLSTALQARIGDSPRGEDIAKGLSWVVIAFVALPGMFIAYFLAPAAELMGSSSAMLLPSTWGADLMTWVAVYFNGISLHPSLILAFQRILQFSWLLDLCLVFAFMILVLGVGLWSADRLFAIGAGPRTEFVKRVGKENIFLRGIRRISSGTFGVLMVMSLKDFGRKAQNISKLVYALFLAILMAIVIRFGPLYTAIDDPLVVPTMSIFMNGFMLAVIGSITFGGIGFLDSRNQLWMLKSSPKGAQRFLAARVTSYFILGFPLAAIPSISTWLITGLDFETFLAMFLFAYSIVCGAILTGIGITAANPTYEDTTSGAFTFNNALTVILSLISMMAGVIMGVLAAIQLDSLTLAISYAILPLPIIGLIAITVGGIRFLRFENA